MKLLCCAAAALLCTVTLPAQTNNVRRLTLQEAIQLAVEHNLDVQIQRFNPLIDKFTIQSLYGVYDPSFNLSGNENYKASAGRFISATGLQAPANQTYDEIVSAGIGGPGGGNATTPWGLNYNLTANVDRTSGIGFDTNGLPFTRPTQYSSFAGITLDQPLLKNFWIDSTRRDILVNKKTQKFDELGVRVVLMDVVTQTEKAYDDLVAKYGTVQVQEKAVELADQQVRENKRKVEVGTLAPLDEKQAESQLAKSKADLIDARQALKATEDALKILITDNYRDWHDARIVPADKLLALKESFDLMDSWNKGMTMRPDLQQLKIDLERRDIVLRYQKNQLFPQLDLTGSYGRSGLRSGLNSSLHDIEVEQFPSYSFGGILSIPLSNRTARNNYKATKAGIDQALLQYKKLEQTILQQIEDSMARAQSAYERIRATREAREFSEAALDAEQKKLEAGKSTSFNVLSLQRDLTTARSAEIQALADYNEALSDLSKNEGSTLERHKLDVKMQ